MKPCGTQRPSAETRRFPPGTRIRCFSSDTLAVFLILLSPSRVAAAVADAHQAGACGVIRHLKVRNDVLSAASRVDERGREDRHMIAQHKKFDGIGDVGYLLTRLRLAKKKDDDETIHAVLERFRALGLLGDAPEQEGTPSANLRCQISRILGDGFLQASRALERRHFS